MNIEPVESLPTPEYPDKYSDEIHDLLATTYPRRWVAKSLVVGALTVTAALSLGSCGILGKTNSADDLQNRYLPIFEYGDGIGSIGCMAIAAPVFLSEEEAFVIMQAAFAEAGLTYKNKTLSLKNATRPVVDKYSHQDDYITENKRGTLKADGVLELGKGTPVVFVSIIELDAWQRIGGGYSTASTYRFKEAAQELANNNPGLIVFYDPVVHIYNPVSIFGNLGDPGFIWAETAEKAQAKSESLLHQQVLAFIEWLRAETSR